MASDRVCPFLSIAASGNLNPETIAKGIMVVYATCTEGCMFYQKNRLMEGGVCGLSNGPSMFVAKGNQN